MKRDPDECAECGHWDTQHDEYTSGYVCVVRYNADDSCACPGYRASVVSETMPRCQADGCNHFRVAHDSSIGPCASKFCTCLYYTEYTNERIITVTTPKKYTLKNGREYIARSLPGFENDVEGLRELVAMGKNVLLLGEPGCGKTALHEVAFPDSEDAVGHHKMTAPDMMWIPRIDPDSKHGVTYDPAPLTRAAIKGVPFYFDEIMRSSEDALTPLFSAMDGRDKIVGGNLDGSDLAVKPGFAVIGASNPLVRGAFLPDAIASRFHILTVETSEELLVKLGLDERLLVIWRNLSATDNGETWRPSIRELLSAQDFINAGNMQQAAFALTGWRVSARDRKAVASVIGPILGVRVGEFGGIIK